MVFTSHAGFSHQKKKQRTRAPEHLTKPRCVRNLPNFPTTRPPQTFCFKKNKGPNKTWGESHHEISCFFLEGGGVWDFDILDSLAAFYMFENFGWIKIDLSGFWT